MLPEVTLKYKLIMTQQICSLQGKLQAWILGEWGWWRGNFPESRLTKSTALPVLAVGPGSDWAWGVLPQRGLQEFLVMAWAPGSSSWGHHTLAWELRGQRRSGETMYLLLTDVRPEEREVRPPLGLTSPAIPSPFLGRPKEAFGSSCISVSLPHTETFLSGCSDGQAETSSDHTDG